jgi:hypothetical protein
VPESTLDRLVLVLGVCALAGLVALIVPAWREYASADDPSRPASAQPPAAPATTEASDSAASPPPTSPPATTRTTSTPAISPPSTATTSPPARKPAPARIAKLALVAAEGDCWIEAHRDSVTGPLLYAGILEQGKKLTLSGRVLWLRLGAPQNLVGRLGTRPVSNLPRGAATVVATPAGVRTLALG